MEGTVLRPPEEPSSPGVARGRRRATRNRASRVERAFVGAVVAATLSYCALRGGSFDAVVRGEQGLAIWWAALLGLGFGLLPRRRLELPSWVVLGALAALVLWTALSFAWTESDERTSIELARVLAYAGLVLLVVMILRSSTAGPAIAGVGVAGGLVCLLALASRLWPDAFPVDRVAAAFKTTRLSYPFNYWNAVAAWGSMTTAMAFAWSAHARHAAWRGVALATVPVATTVVYLTYSRAGLMGLAIATIAALVLARARIVMFVQVVAAAAASYLPIHAVRDAPAIADATGSAGRADVLVALVAGAALCAVVAIALLLAGADERLRLPPRVGRPAFVATCLLVVVIGGIALAPVARRGIDQFNNDSSITETADPAKRLASAAGNRHNLWTSALDAFDAHPLRGTGPGTFEFWWNRDKVDPEHVRDAHSLYIESLAETGIIGFLGVLALCGSLLLALARLRLNARGRSQTGAAAAALGAFVVWLFHAGVDWMWEETAVTALALVLGAAACAAPQRRSMHALPLGVRLGCVALAALALIVQLPVPVGTSKVRNSQQELADGDPAAGLAAANDAIRAWPWAAEPYAARARAEEALGHLARAGRDARAARRREPTNWRRPLLVARIALERGNLPVARSAFQAAVRLRPLGSSF